ncbi:MAG: response regulator [Spongiibacteraceae bacterium]
MLSEQPLENRFLIVDHYPFGRDMLRRNLLFMGAEKVDIAVSASIAITMCKKVDYDVVIADYNLGDGKNGQQLLEELRSQKMLSNVSAFIIITSETQRDAVLSTLEYQPDDYVAKPYTQDLLLRRVSKILRYKSSLHSVFQSIDNKNYHLAIQGCQHYLQNYEEFSSRCLRILGELYQNINEMDKAQEIYDAELVANDSDWARLGLAQVYMSHEYYNEAEALLLELMDINYMYIDVYAKLADIYIQASQYGKAEEVMAKAVTVSPLSIRFQQDYAKLCERNNHYEPAISAWRSIIKISRNTQYESAENHLNLARCLNDFCEYINGYEDKKITDEIIKNLDIIKNKFHADGDNELQSLFIEGRGFFAQGHKTAAAECMHSAKKIYGKNIDTVSSQSQIEFAKTLARFGDNPYAEKVLDELIEKTDDIETIAKADKVLEEPVSKSGKEQIILLNRQGIKYFKTGEYNKAVVSFREAQMQFPKNIELNLNFVQSLLKLVSKTKNPNNKNMWLQESEQCLAQIKDLKSSHKKFHSYRRLHKELMDLASNNTTVNS